MHMTEENLGILVTFYQFMPLRHKHSVGVKGAPMFKSGSEFGNGTHTIVFATLENPGSTSRNFPIGLVRDFRPFLRIFASSQKEANYRPIGVKHGCERYFYRMQINLGYKLTPEKIQKNHVKIFSHAFFSKN